MNKITVGFLWHMHQPYYRDPLTGSFLMPWVRLHAVRGYYDMISVLDDFPDVKCTFNLVPSLISQLLDYTENNQTDIDFVLSGRKPAELSPDEKKQILQRFFSCNQATMITPFSRYEELLKKKAGKKTDEFARDFSDQDIMDLQVLFNLTWIGFTGRKDPGIAELIKKGRQFGEYDKKYVLDFHMKMLAKIIPLYRDARDRGQIEITTSPFYHPISPLLMNVGYAHRCMETRLPEEGFSHPEDLEAQIEKSIDLYKKVFGDSPDGLWPPEGSVCPEMMEILSRYGIKWAATDEDILFLSLREQRTGVKLFRPYKVVQGSSSVDMFFRDRDLSDMIGFVYSKNASSTAAANFISHLEDIRKGARTYPFNPFVSVILDGENPWEYYPDGGEGFLRELYQGLSGSQNIITDTFSSYLAANPVKETVENLFTGSWINHNFSIWIGHEEDRKAWEYLSKTRKYVESKGKDAHKLSWEEIYIAEGSDWFWWFGDEFTILNKGDFDRLFRLHLRNCYELHGDVPPSYLFKSIITPYDISPQKEPSGFVRPVIDGFVTHFYEWRKAGVYLTRPESSSMYRHSGYIHKILYGFDEQHLYFKLETAALPINALVKICFILDKPVNVILNLAERRMTLQTEGGTGISGGETGKMAVGDSIELGISFSALGLKPHDKIRFYFILMESGIEIERHPSSGLLALEVPGEDFERKMWYV
jgi:alpha-amylase/alpha-mannosidase (GH57 family)